MDQPVKHKLGDVDPVTGKIFLQRKRKGNHSWDYWVTPEQYRKTCAITLESGRKWAAANHQRELDRGRARYAADPNRAILYAVLADARRRAREHNLPFDLKFSDIVIPERCPVLGIPLIRGKGKQHAGSPSLDRIIPNLGYVRGNVVVVSLRANRLKSNATLDEIRAIARFYCHI
jgi:hypothetical protein